MREFETGATRDTDEGKYDYEGFLSPLAIERYAEYMHKHRKQADGKMRDSDNWQKGIPITQYIKSLWRHFFAVWKGHRLGAIQGDDLCAVIFNSMGALHEILKTEKVGGCFDESDTISTEAWEKLKPSCFGAEKPPLGLRPRIIAEEARLEEINQAIKRYLNAGREIPIGWLEERGDICASIKGIMNDED